MPNRRTRAESKEEVAYLIRLVEHAPGDPMTIQSDAAGRVIFREAVPKDVIEAGVERCVAIGTSILGRAAAIATEYDVSRVTLKLALDAKIGCAFICGAGLAAAIEIEIRRSSSSAAAG